MSSLFYKLVIAVLIITALFYGILHMNKNAIENSKTTIMTENDNKNTKHTLDNLRLLMWSEYTLSTFLIIYMIKMLYENTIRLETIYLICGIIVLLLNSFITLYQDSYLKNIDVTEQQLKNNMYISVFKTLMCIITIVILFYTARNYVTPRFETVMYNFGDERGFIGPNGRKKPMSRKTKRVTTSTQPPVQKDIDYYINTSILPSSVANKPNAKKFVKFNDDGPKTYIQIKSDRRSIRNSNKIVNSSDLQNSALNMFQNKDDRVTTAPKRKYTKKDKTSVQTSNDVNSSRRINPFPEPLSTDSSDNRYYSLLSPRRRINPVSEPLYNQNSSVIDITQPPKRRINPVSEPLENKNNNNSESYINQFLID